MGKTSVRHLPIAGGPGPSELLTPARLLDDHVDDLESSGFEGGVEDDGHEEKLLRVGDIAKASGKTVRAIHHYEDVGLLTPHARSKGRYRLYDERALTRVRWIGKLHDLGFSLAEIQKVVATWEAAPSAPQAMSTVREIYQRKLEETRAQVARLAALERELEASVAYLDTCDTCDPAELVAACTHCNVRPRSRREPELVAGIYSGARNEDITRGL